MGAPRKDVTLQLVPLRLWPEDIVAAEMAAEDETEATEVKWDRSRMLREWARLGRRQWEDRIRL